MPLHTLTARIADEIERTEQLVRAREDSLAVPRETAEFLHALVLAGGFRRGLEIGTSYGYSGLWLAAALARHGGVLVTIERDPAKATHARQVFARAGLADVVTLRQADALEVLRQLAGPFDFVFVDADKPTAIRYFELFWPHLAQHATIVTDNIVSHAEPLRAYVAHLRGHPQLFSTAVGIGSGLELSVKFPAASRVASIDGADWVI